MATNLQPVDLKSHPARRDALALVVCNADVDFLEHIRAVLPDHTMTIWTDEIERRLEHVVQVPASALQTHYHRDFDRTHENRIGLAVQQMACLLRPCLRRLFFCKCCSSWLGPSTTVGGTEVDKALADQLKANRSGGEQDDVAKVL